MQEVRYAHELRMQLRGCIGKELRDMETGVKAGDSSCGDAMAHESPNNAKSVNEAITIEFKNRDRFKP